MTATVTDLVHDLIDPGALLDQLTELLAEKHVGERPEIGGGKPGTRPPWDATVASVLMDVHATARDLEAHLHSYVYRAYWRRMAGSDRHTRRALENVVMYCDLDAVPEEEVRATAKALARLVHRAQSLPAIDTAPPPATVLDHPCPSCGTGALVADQVSMGVTCDPCGEHWVKAQWPLLLGKLMAARGGAL